ncbi:hypothetical protein CO174_05330 [Candidatus Uhrbacteria bacterium CG_4_9_14_3_um_filter_50_9]|uniref:Uncharacterized protein n=1 Tax=Candidatus Uhrbacteria bacterium CG_4_9_14_3_um_filter_50_9 TaxID=1975035 RepID=A0A2M7XAZ0_9BACT|nr:MAG: hypothetical protein CO174_05330 [Candidatus Uhrbacteria bacterium CG_4_9_14_3_um_filter_50_9]
MRYLFLPLLVVLAVLTGCYREHKMTFDEPSHSNLEKWGNYLEVTDAPPDAPIATTQTQISNVSPLLALAKISQALESQSGTEYRLSTVFQVAVPAEDIGDQPIITDVVVDGHYYYVAPLDYPKRQENRASFVQTNGKIPAIAVVDAEDETKPAWIRTTDAEGNTYEIVVRFNPQENLDQDYILRLLRSKGYRTYGSHRLDDPTLEFDDNWRPYYTATYVDDDGFANVGTAYFPESLLVVDAQTREVTAYALDNPNTTDANERDEKIPDWVDRIYSEQLILDWISYWGYNLDNYGKTSSLNEFMADGGRFDVVMNADNTNLVYVAYITSTQQDNSTVGTMLIDPRTSKAVMYWSNGPETAMATKSTAVNAIRQATIRWGYEVEDLTLHTIYGVRTWEGILTRPAFDNAGQPYGSLYAGTVLLQANYDVRPADVVFAQTKHEAFSRYEELLYLKQGTRVGSNVLEDSEISGVVRDYEIVVVGGNTSYLVRLEGQKGKLWEVPIKYVGDPHTEAALELEVGDTVFIQYGDPRNRQTYLVRHIEVTQKGD